MDKKAEEQKKLEEALLKALDSGEAVEMNDEDWDEIKAVIKSQDVLKGSIALKD